jgi:hypothetical protein
MQGVSAAPDLDAWSLVANLLAEVLDRQPEQVWRLLLTPVELGA